jgi:hypothetical protein
MSTTRAVNVGELRPSQLLFTSGVGAVVDLPQMSAMVLGLDEWPQDAARRLAEPRLLAAVQRRLGGQVAELRTPPETPDDHGPLDDLGRVSVPVAPFPRWLRCPRCRLLAPIESGLFRLKPEPYRPDRVRYTHDCDGKGNVVALAARFLLACPAGHHDDFPWIAYVHAGPPCARPQLELAELGSGGQAADIMVACRACGRSRRMSGAFGAGAEDVLPRCRGRHPHLSEASGSCDQPARTILLGASNAWFPVSLSVLSIPSAQDQVGQLVEDGWARLEQVPSTETLAFAVDNLPELAALKGVDLDRVWQEIERRRHGDGGEQEDEDLRAPEWAVLADPGSARESDDFRLSARPAPEGFASTVAEVVLAERLREVIALVGFTRVESPEDVDMTQEGGGPAPLARRPPTWVPCTEVRGEGVFLRLDEQRVSAWEQRYGASQPAQRLHAGYRAWRTRRNLDPHAGWPGLRYVLLHTLAHALIRELALECGYGASAIRERIFATRPDGAGPEMAGLLLYTAAPDSEGTLGGLVSLGEPDQLGRLLAQALEHARMCSSDPLCSEHDPSGDRSAHLAACHACLFAAETSCERGNRFLDRAALVDTFTTAGLGLFG